MYFLLGMKLPIYEYESAADESDIQISQNGLLVQIVKLPFLLNIWKYYSFQCCQMWKAQRCLKVCGGCKCKVLLKLISLVKNCADEEIYASVIYKMQEEILLIQKVIIWTKELKKLQLSELYEVRTMSIDFKTYLKFCFRI